MRFSAKEDIEASVEDAFKVLSDFETIERSAIRRGIDVRRNNADAGQMAGTTWDIGFEFRGSTREAVLTLTQYDAPNSLSFEAVSSGIDVKATVEVVALSKTRSRLSVTADLEATNLTARLLIQSLKLAKGTLDRKYDQRVSAFAKRVEAVAANFA